jgi:signal transduction histidine kinase
MLSVLYLNAALLLSHMFLIHRLNHTLQRYRQDVRFSSMFYGILYGVVGNLLMYYSIHLQDGGILDLRFLSIMLAGKLGGVPGALISSLIVAAGRILLFPLSEAAVTSSLLTVVGGIATAILAYFYRSLRLSHWALLMFFYLAASIIGFTFLLTSRELLTTIIIEFIIFNTSVGSMAYYFCVYLENAEKAREKLQRSSRTDALTGLSNFRGLQSQLQALLKQTSSSKISPHLFLLDGKETRLLNVKLGYKEVNRLLVLAAEVLQEYLPGAYSIARYNGDKFVILIDGLQQQRTRHFLLNELPRYCGLQFETLSLELRAGISEQEIVAVMEDQMLMSKKERWKKEEERLLHNEKLKTVGEMAAGLAHEIRNPLTSVKGFLQIGKQQGDVGKYYDIILEEVGRMNELTKEFLQFSRPNAADVMSIALLECVNRALQLAESQALRLGHQLQWEGASAAITVRADPNKLVQVLLNLMQNGLEAMPESGTLRVTMYESPERFAVVEITDTGTGIPEDQLEQIFHPFFSTKESGTGLGLSICQKIIQDHRGTLRVRSKVGLGTTFTLSLPCA